MLPILLLTVIAFALIILFMAVGAMFQGKCLRGSCGGPEILTGDGVPVTCDTCPLKDKADAARRQAEAVEA